MKTQWLFSQLQIRKECGTRCPKPVRPTRVLHPPKPNPKGAPPAEPAWHNGPKGRLRSERKPPQYSLIIACRIRSLSSDGHNSPRAFQASSGRPPYKNSRITVSTADSVL